MSDEISIDQLVEAVRAVDILAGTVHKHDVLLERIIEKLEAIEKRLDTLKPPRK